MMPNRILHTVNYAYDGLFEGVTNGHWLLDFTPLILLAMALIVACYRPATTHANVAGSNPHGPGRGI